MTKIKHENKLIELFFKLGENIMPDKTISEAELLKNAENRQSKELGWLLDGYLAVEIFVAEEIKKAYQSGEAQALKWVEEEVICPFCENTGEVWNNKEEKNVGCGENCIYLKLQLIKQRKAITNQTEEE